MTELAPVTRALQAMARRRKFAALMRGLLPPALVLAAFSAASFALDYWLHLPVAVRAVQCVATLGLLVWFVWQRILRPLAERPGVERLALLAEASDPEIKDQIISALQLEQDLAAGTAVESPELIRALVTDTARRFQHARFPAAAPLGTALRHAVLAVLLLGLPVSFLSQGGEHAAIWWQRNALLQSTPWPRLHHLEVRLVGAEMEPAPADATEFIWHVAERTPLQVTVAAADGTKLPDAVSLHMQALEGDAESVELPLGRSPGGNFQHIFPPLMKSFRFHVTGGDDDDGVPTHEIRVARAPRVTSLLARLEYPAYTRMESREIPDPNLSAPAGTRVSVEFKVNMELKDFAVTFGRKGLMSVAPAGELAWRMEFVIEGADTWTWKLRGSNNVPSADVPRYVITAEPDQPPRLNLVSPATSTLLVSPDGVIPFMGTATDDFGVTELALRYGPEGSPPASVLPCAPEDLSQPLGARQIAFFRPQSVAEFRVPDESAAGGMRAPREGDRLHVRVALADNRVTATEPEPHRLLSEQEFHVQVQSPPDLLKEFSQRQVRLKDRAIAIVALFDQRIAECDELVAALKRSSDGAPGEPRFVALEQGVARANSELGTLARQFLRIAEGYLWNRMDRSFLTEKLIEVLTRGFRAHPEQEFTAVFAEALKEVRPAIDNASLMGRVASIMDLALVAAFEHAPVVQQGLRAVNATPLPSRLAPLEASAGRLRTLRDEVVLLAEKLEAWENYLDVVQGFRDLLDLQKGVEQKLRKLTRK